MFPNPERLLGRNAFIELCSASSPDCRSHSRCRRRRNRCCPCIRGGSWASFCSTLFFFFYVGYFVCADKKAERSARFASPCSSNAGSVHRSLAVAASGAPAVPRRRRQLAATASTCGTCLAFLFNVPLWSRAFVRAHLGARKRGIVRALPMTSVETLSGIASRK